MKAQTELKIFHFVILLVSVAAAGYLLASPDFYKIIVSLNSLGYIGAFIAGIFFSSMFTTVPATVTLFVLGSSLNPLLIAPIAALGAVIADFLIFTLIKYRLSHHYGIIDKIVLWFRTRRITKYIKKHKFLKHLIPISGGLIIASPLPDEFGIAILGASKYDTKRFFILAFVMNTLGVLLISYFGTLT